MYHYPGSHTYNYSSSSATGQGYPSYPYATQAQGYTVPYYAPAASQSAQSAQRSSPASSQASASSKPAKRPRSKPMFGLPELPTSIFKVAAAHNSLELPWDSEYGSSKRLEAIGRKILPAVIMEILSARKPIEESFDLTEEVEKRLETTTLAEWCTQCDLRKHVLCVPTAREGLNDPDASCDVLYTFVGAVHAAFGTSGVRAWLGQLIDPSYEEGENAYKRAKLEPATNGFYQSQPPPPTSQPPPPTSQPPPPPTGAPPPMPARPSSGAAMISYLNEVLQKRQGSTLEWKANMSGPSHNPQWTVECILNGIVKGSGTAQSKQVAKEQAARVTVQMMGF